MHPGVPLAAFGMIAGTIAGIAAAERRRDYYERPYYGTPHAYGGYGYAQPQVYAPPYGYAQPYGYAPHGYPPRRSTAAGSIRRAARRHEPGVAARLDVGRELVRGGTCRRDTPRCWGRQIPVNN